MTDRTDPQRPRTEAGRDALRFLDPDYSPSPEWRAAILAIEAEASLAAPAGLREAAARFVAEYWRDEYLRAIKEQGTTTPWAIGSHPLAMVLAALDGETDPTQLGIGEDRYDEFRAALSSPHVHDWRDYGSRGEGSKPDVRCIAAGHEAAPRSPEPPRSYWMEFLEWEAEAAKQGSGLTAEQMTGAAAFRSFLVNIAPDAASPETPEAAPALDAAWERALDLPVPTGYFGPAVEPRAFGRWRAWFRPIEGNASTIDGWGETEAASLEALARLASERGAKP